MKLTIIKTALAVTTLSVLMPWALVCAEAGSPSPAPAAELQRLQGSWEGVLEGHETEGRVSITITGNTLQFQGLKPTQRYAATFTLPAGTDPQQLHATIKEGLGPKDVGQVVFAIFKIENGTLTLAGISESDAQSPRLSGKDPGFENNSLFRYDLRKVRPKKKVPQ